MAKDIKGCSRTQLLRTIALECAISEMKIVHQPIPIQRLHLGVAYLACIYANLHSHSECFLAHRMVKNDQYTVIRQPYLGLSAKKLNPKKRISGTAQAGWRVNHIFSWMDRIGRKCKHLLQTASYYTILAVLHCNATIPQQNTSHPPQYTTPLPLSHHRTCQAREPDGRELQPTS